MTEPDWMPRYKIELWEGGARNRILQTVQARSDREVDATLEARSLLDDAWKPGPREGRRVRPLIAVVKRFAGGRSEETARLTWTLNGVVRTS